MSVALNFDSSQYEPMREREPVPAGTYRAQIIESELKPTKKNDGRYLQLTWQIVDGPYKGQYMWDQLNLQNPNSQTVDIAQRQLTSICRAIGVTKVGDSGQLHNKPALLTVTIKQDAGYAPKNRITKYDVVDGATIAPASQSAAAGTPPKWSVPAQKSA